MSTGKADCVRFYKEKAPNRFAIVPNGTWKFCLEFFIIKDNVRCVCQFRRFGREAEGFLFLG